MKNAIKAFFARNSKVIAKSCYVAAGVAGTAAVVAGTVVAVKTYKAGNGSAGATGDAPQEPAAQAAQ